ncbi:MAG: hypothetical protein R3Y38_00645 [Rikenellaceae bacterium]
MKTKNLFLIAACMLAVSCGASKKATVSQDTEVIVPCSGLEFTTSAEYFRANALGISTSMEIASQKAMTAARAKLAAALETTVKTVTDNFLSSYEDGTDEAARARFQSMTREVVSQKLNGIRVICQKTMKTPEGQFKAYVAIELAGKEITEAITKNISDDSKLRTDYEYQKFLETFDKEMKALAESENK